MALINKHQSHLRIKVVPNANQTQLVGRQGDFIKIKIAAVPDKNKANQELQNFLATNFGMKKDEIYIIRGHKNHRKILLIPTIKADQINRLVK